ncbi:MAG: hypothetical protein WAW42_07465 [Candidatus Competibacteraceae bacterium]
MGEWSDYFENFPEEDPANYVGNRFDPEGARARRVANSKVAAEQARLNAEIAHIIQKHSKPSAPDKGSR